MTHTLQKSTWTKGGKVLAFSLMTVSISTKIIQLSDIFLYHNISIMAFALSTSVNVSSTLDKILLQGVEKSRLCNVTMRRIYNPVPSQADWIWAGTCVRLQTGSEKGVEVGSGSVHGVV